MVNPGAFRVGPARVEPMYQPGYHGDHRAGDHGGEVMRKTVAIQAVGYLVLLPLIYAWFGIADRSVWQVLLSVRAGGRDCVCAWCG